MMIDAILLEDWAVGLINVPGKWFRCGGFVNIRREKMAERELRGRSLVIEQSVLDDTGLQSSP